jgi:O-methyltransferase
MLRMIYSLLEQMKPQILKKDKIIQQEFLPIFKKVENYTMTSIERAYTLYKSVHYILKNRIDGDFVECGTWRGGSAMVMAYALVEAGDLNRKIFLYDTFEGMSKPTTEDVKNSDKKLFAVHKWKINQNTDHNDWCYSPLSEVKENMSLTGYPLDKIVFVKGKVEDTIPKSIPEKIALLRLDTDWYASTKHELKHLYPILSNKGVLILDDYGFWAGAKKATDEYFSCQSSPLLVRIDDTGRVGVKL